MFFIATNLGAANDYNLFLLGNLTQSNTDSEGRVAVAGNAMLANYGVGAALGRSDTRGDLIVGGTLDVDGGENFNGNTVIGSRANVLRYNMTNGNGVPNQPLEGTPVDFDSAAGYLRCASLSWAALAANGTTAVQYGGLTLTGVSTILNVFQIDGTDVAGSGKPLSGLNQINIAAPAGSTILINILGSTLGFGSYSIFRNGVAATGQDGQFILWNLPQATNLIAGTTSVKGSILAPRATYVAGYGNFEGTMVLDTLVGNIEAHNFPFAGNLPETGCGTPKPTEPGGTGGASCPYRQAMSDILESIALEQTALSHILNAEGEKIQKIIAIDADTDAINRVNASACSMVEAVTRLEVILLAKAESAAEFCSGKTK